MVTLFQPMAHLLLACRQCETIFLRGAWVVTLKGGMGHSNPFEKYSLTLLIFEWEVGLYSHELEKGYICTYDGRD
jgi:hypothetical protein